MFINAYFIKEINDRHDIRRILFSLRKEQKEYRRIRSKLKTKFKLTDLGIMTSYIGIYVKNHDDGALELTQPYLIQKFIEYYGCKDSNSKRYTLY